MLLFFVVSRSTLPLRATGGILGNPTLRRDHAWTRNAGRGRIRALVVSSDTEVVGREDELALLREFVSGLAQGARAIGIRGEPGIGKTTLWRAAIEVAEAAGLAVLSARCVEAELPLGFAGLSDLVHEALPGVADELSDHIVLRSSLPSTPGSLHQGARYEASPFTTSAMWSNTSPARRLTR